MDSKNKYPPSARELVRGGGGGSNKIEMELRVFGGTVESGSMRTVESGSMRTVESGSMRTEPLNVTSTPKKNRLIRDLLRNYVRFCDSHHSGGDRMKASQKTTSPVEEVLEKGTEYTHNGVKYNSIKKGNERFTGMIDDVLHTVVLENGNRLTMVPNSWLSHAK
jgi:hypothetical protein